MIPRARLAAAAVLLLCVSMVAVRETSAQQVADAETLLQTTTVFDTKLFYPLPSWSTGMADAFEFIQQSKVSLQQTDQQYFQVQFPVNETPRSAMQTMSVVGLNMGPGNIGVPLAAYRKMTRERLVNTCEAGGFGEQTLDEAAESVTALVYCTVYRPEHASLGRGVGNGQISLVRIVKHRNLFVQVSQDWFGPGFSFDDEASWPVLRAEIDRMRARYTLIRISDKASR